MRGSSPARDRGVSERLGVLTLVVLTVVVTATLGVGVLFIDTGAEESLRANFTFDHYPQSQTLLVTYSNGENLTAGDVVFSGPDGNVTWAAAAGTGPASLVRPNDAVQLGESGAYGAPVAQDTPIVVVYRPAEGNATVVDSWNRAGTLNP